MQSNERADDADPGQVFIEELLRTGFALIDLMGSLIDEFPEDAYPGEDNAAVVLEMVGAGASMMPRRSANRATLLRVTAGSHPLSLRLGAAGERALEEIARKRGVTRAEAARQAITEAAERERKRSGLAAEVARLADDPADRAARAQVMADMDAVAAEWPD